MNCGDGCWGCRCERGRGGGRLAGAAAADEATKRPRRLSAQYTRTCWTAAGDTVTDVTALNGFRGCLLRRESGCFCFRRGHGILQKTSIPWTRPRERPWGDVVCRQGRGGRGG